VLASETSGAGAHKDPEWSLPVLFSIGAYLVLVVRTAWVGDDAYLTFRVVDNFAHGFGLRWNVAERVQVFTCPLWTLLLSLAHALTGELYYTALALSLALSLLAASIVLRGLARSLELTLLSAFCLCLSRAYVDYSTSGLENPLTHCLLALFAFSLWYRRSFRVTTICAGLLALNRLDALILVLPTLVLLVFRRRGQGPYTDLSLGFLPLGAWFLFSIVYYGFPFPNTAYAKLATAIPARELVNQGVLYLLNSLASDPLTLFVIVVSIVAALRFRVPFALPIALGILLYLAYVVRIGGDFMSGRFLTAPFLLSVVLLSQLPVRLSSTGFAVAFAALLVAGFPGFEPSFAKSVSDTGRSLIDPNGIADERLFYAPTSALLSARRGIEGPPSQSASDGRWARIREKDLVVGGNGMFGLYAGPGVHVLDRNALSDPLLARLPAKRGWRIGHFVRAIPQGYVRELRGRPPGLADPDLAAYVARLLLVTRGELFTVQRWKAIYDLNLGDARHLLDHYAQIHSRMQVVPLGAVSEPRPDGWDPAGGGVVFSDYGAAVVLPEVSHGGEVELSLENTEKYEVEGRKQGELVWHSSVPVLPPASDNLAVHRLKLEPIATDAGYDEVRIFPQIGEDEYALGHLRLIQG
jgi:arabinofuranosyltransferase